MVIAAFVIASLVIIIALGAVQGAKGAQEEQARIALERDASSFLTDVRVPDMNHAHGVYEGVEVDIVLGHHEIHFDARLAPALVPFRQLVELFASADLKARLADLNLEVTAADSLHGSIPREPAVGECLVTIEKRLELVHAIGALRKHAPSLLLDRLKKAHDSREVDEMLLALAHAYPNAPETKEAIAHAAHLEHTDARRIEERAAQWLSAGRLPAFPVR